MAVGIQYLSANLWLSTEHDHFVHVLSAKGYSYFYSTKGYDVVLTVPLRKKKRLSLQSVSIAFIEELLYPRVSVCKEFTTQTK